jgi:hypothetical protein
MGAHLRRGARRLNQPPPPAFVVHSLIHAVAALGAAADAARPIVLLSAPDAGISAGPGWFKALADAARDAVPTARFIAVLDCGDDAGAAQGAIRAGIDAIIYSGRADVAGRLAAIAQQADVSLLTTRPQPLLDLGELFFASSDTLRERCTDVIASV